MFYLPDLDWIRNTAIQNILNDIGHESDYSDDWLIEAISVAEYFKSLEKDYQQFYLKNYWPKQPEYSQYYIMT